MSRRQFIENEGASCANWFWSWSFVDHKRERIIFGAWADHLINSKGLIFSNTWERNNKGRRQNAWPQSRDHIRLVEEKGYDLFVYRMYCENVEEAEIGIGPRKIRSFERKLMPAHLLRESEDWYAVL